MLRFASTGDKNAKIPTVEIPWGNVCGDATCTISDEEVRVELPKGGIITDSLKGVKYYFDPSKEPIVWDWEARECVQRSGPKPTRIF